MPGGAADPTARTLRLLALLQTQASWPGAELARRLEVSPRTLRRDVRRLQGLGYRVDSRPGPGGRYLLSGGTRIPPLLFDEDEVRAILDPEVLGVLTLAAAEEREASFDYVDSRGRPSRRRVDSLTCLVTRKEWYAIGFDVDRDDWRLFRLDRITTPDLGARLTPARTPPSPDWGQWLATDFGRRSAAPSEG